MNKRLLLCCTLLTLTACNSENDSAEISLEGSWRTSCEQLADGSSKSYELSFTKSHAGAGELQFAEVNYQNETCEGKPHNLQVSRGAYLTGEAHENEQGLSVNELDLVFNKNSAAVASTVVQAESDGLYFGVGAFDGRFTLSDQVDTSRLWAMSANSVDADSMLFGAAASELKVHVDELDNELVQQNAEGCIAIGNAADKPMSCGLECDVLAEGAQVDSIQTFSGNGCGADVTLIGYQVPVEGAQQGQGGRLIPFSITYTPWYCQPVSSITIPNGCCSFFYATDQDGSGYLLPRKEDPDCAEHFD